MAPSEDPLGPDSVDADPIGQFRRWYDEAVVAGVRQPDAMTLATASFAGAVTARTVLLRGLDAFGFSFFTNLESAKGEQLAANPRAALVFTGGSRSARSGWSVRCAGSTMRRRRVTGRTARAAIA
jgi:pyridoxine/pyridoxamine 5'-phosphate oxidase